MECLEWFKKSDYPYRSKWLSACHDDEDFDFKKKAATLLIPGSDAFFQLHGFLQKLSTIPFSKKPSAYSPNPIVMSESAGKDFDIRYKQQIEDALLKEERPKSENGADRTFKWNNRSTLKVLEKGGEVYEALAALKKEADNRNVNLVIYSTPTVSHKDAPWVYPEGYLETYRKRMKQVTHELGIAYYDYSDFFPWREEIMLDFIHPQGKIRPLLHQDLLYKLYRDRILK